MSYCRNCGTLLPDGARFCALCGTPADSGQGYGNEAQAYGNVQTQGNAVPPYADGIPYSNMPPYGNAGQGYADGQAYGNAGQPYAGSQGYGNEAQAYGNAGQPYAGGQGYGNEGQPYANGQGYGNVGTPYQGMPGCAGMGGAFNGNPYSPYGAAAQPQNSRKTLAVIGIIVGLIVMIALVLLIVLLTRDNRHRTYEQVVGVYMDGLKKQDLDRMEEAFPERIREALRRDMLRYYDSEDEFWEDYNESLEWFCGKHVKMTYKIAQAEPLLDYRIADCEQECMEEYHYDVSISAGYEVELEITFKGSEDEYDTELDLEVVEIDGKWYVFPD